MISALDTSFASGVMLSLAAVAARAIILACLAALVLAVLRVRQVTVHLAVWTGVLYAALAMPLLVRLAPTIPFRIPKPQRAERSTRPLDTKPLSHPSSTTLDSRQLEIEGAVPSSPSTGNGTRPSVRAQVLAQGGRPTGAAVKLPQIAAKRARKLGMAVAKLARIATPARILAIYILGLLFFLGRLLTGFFLGRRLRRSLISVEDPRALQWMERQAGAMGLKCAPSLAESPAASGWAKWR